MINFGRKFRLKNLRLLFFLSCNNIIFVTKSSALRPNNERTIRVKTERELVWMKAKKYPIYLPSLALLQLSGWLKSNCMLKRLFPFNIIAFPSPLTCGNETLSFFNSFFLCYYAWFSMLDPFATQKPARETSLESRVSQVTAKKMLMFSCFHVCIVLS